MKDRQAFIETVKEEIRRRHKGVIARHRMRPPEFAAWEKAIPLYRQAWARAALLSFDYYEYPD